MCASIGKNGENLVKSTKAGLRRSRSKNTETPGAHVRVFMRSRWRMSKTNTNQPFLVTLFMDFNLYMKNLQNFTFIDRFGGVENNRDHFLHSLNIYSNFSHSAVCSSLNFADRRRITAIDEYIYSVE